MIEITHVETFGFEAAIRGMRNPYMSHDKSDSRIEPDCKGCWIGDLRDGCNYCNSNGKGYVHETFSIGNNDLSLAKKLIKGGSEHRKFLRMIHVQADVLAPRYWWAEMDTYKWVTKNSSSTMHLITKRELTLDDFSRDEAYNITVFEKVVESLNTVINLYNALDSGETRVSVFRAIKQFLPESYNQLRTIDTNYEVLLSIYHQRKNHRLSEWHEFCKWIESLPYMKEFLEV